MQRDTKREEETSKNGNENEGSKNGQEKSRNAINEASERQKVLKKKGLKKKKTANLATTTENTTLLWTKNMN